ELTLAKAHLAAADERHTEALSIARAAAREARAASDLALALDAEEAVARSASAAGARDEARRARERSAELASAAGDLAALARALHSQARAALDRDDPAEAERIALELLADQSRLGDAAGQADALRALAEAQLRMSRPDEAGRALERALALAGPRNADGPLPADPAATLRLVAEAALDRGDRRAARSSLEEARLLIPSSPRARHLQALVAADLARVALADGDVAGAGHHAAAADAARREHACRRCGADIAATLVSVALASGDAEAARAHRSDGLEQALRLDLPAARARIERAFEAGADGASAASAG
ncbi:MAG TPA: hypothetical protein VFM93_04655, partial [Candidatus Limnocylindria bacterium]|nr:hypothetical protein [Candidatus Limnocylindria bacterium]